MILIIRGEILPEGVAEPRTRPVRVINIPNAIRADTGREQIPVGREKWLVFYINEEPGDSCGMMSYSYLYTPCFLSTAVEASLIGSQSLSVLPSAGL